MRSAKPILAPSARLPGATPSCQKPGEGEEEGRGRFQEGDAARPGRGAPAAHPRPNLEITGTVEATTYVAVNPRIEDAEILELKADVGDRVTAGDVLAIFDKTDAQMVRDDAGLSGRSRRPGQGRRRRIEGAPGPGEGPESHARAGPEDLDRGKAQAEKGAISQESLDTFQYKRDQEARPPSGSRPRSRRPGDRRAREEQAGQGGAHGRPRRRKLSWATLRAPISGIVAKRQAAKGQQTLFTSLARGALFELFDPASLVVNVQVTQRDLPFVRQGLESRSRATPVPDRPSPGSWRSCLRHRRRGGHGAGPHRDQGLREAQARPVRRGPHRARGKSEHARRARARRSSTSASVRT